MTSTDEGRPEPPPTTTLRGTPVHGRGARARRRGFSRAHLIPMGILAGTLIAAACERSPAPRPVGAKPTATPDGAGVATGDATGQSPPAHAPRPLPDDPFRLRNLARLHAERDTAEGYAEAVRVLEALTERFPDEPELQLDLARCALFTKEDPGRAAAPIARARELWGTEAPPDVDYVEALLLRRREDGAGAARLLRKVTELLPQNPYGWYQLGRALELQREFSGAVDAFRHALLIEPRHRAAAYHVVQCLGRLRLRDEMLAAREVFEKLKDDPERDTEKCSLTRVTLRPVARAAAEPKPMSTLNWRDRTADLLPGVALEHVTRVVPMWVASHCTPHLLVVHDAGIRQLRRGPGGEWKVRELLPEGDRELWDAVSGDLDDDGLADIVAHGPDRFLLLLAREEGGYQLLPGMPQSGAQALALCDLDHDGDLDVPYVRDGELRALRNNGDRTFEDTNPFPAAAHCRSLGFLRFDVHDLDQGSDLDLLLPAEEQGLIALLNGRERGYAPIPVPLPHDAHFALCEDFTGDGAPDLVAVAPEEITLAENEDRFGSPAKLRLRTPRTTKLGAVTVRDARAADVDDDGDLDLLLATDRGLEVARMSATDFVVEDEVVTLAGPLTSVECADLDGDGHLEVLVTGEDGRLRVLDPGADPERDGIAIAPQGRADNRDAIGTVVEVHAGRHYQSVMIKEQGGIHLGLGDAGRAGLDGLRLRWPQGIVQSVLADDLTIDAEGWSRFPQKEGLVASCPFLYARGAAGWRYVTDAVGIAPLDEWLPPGEKPFLDPEELVRLPEGALAEVDGGLHLALTEELRETTYLDRVELIAVDHPADLVARVDGSTRAPERDPLLISLIPRGRTAAVRDLRAEQAAEPITDDLVARADGRYAHPYPRVRSQWGGWVPRHGLEFTLAEPADTLLLTGRLAWYDSKVVYALHQNGRGWGPLQLWRVGPRGEQERLLDLGLLRGMDRTIVARLPRELAAGTRLRLTAHHRFLWDEITSARGVSEVDLSAAGGGAARSAGAVRARALPLAAARLAFHGFAKATGDVSRHEQRYDFDDAGPDDTYPRATGLATRYGDVRELLAAFDDRLVVLVAGDGVELSFAPPPQLAAGLRRTYFARISGWCKEGSYHNATGSRIEPLPYRGMESYPPPRPLADGDATEANRRTRTREIR